MDDVLPSIWSKLRESHLLRDADIYRVRRWEDDILIGPSTAFGFCRRSAKLNGEYVRGALKEHLAYRGGSPDLRVAVLQRSIGPSERGARSNCTIGRIVSAIKAGRLDAYRVTNTHNLWSFCPDVAYASTILGKWYPSKDKTRPENNQNRGAESTVRVGSESHYLERAMVNMWPLEIRIAETVRRSIKLQKVKNAGEIDSRNINLIVAVLSVWAAKSRQDSFALSALVNSRGVFLPIKSIFLASEAICVSLQRARSAINLQEIDDASIILAGAIDEIGVTAFDAAIEEGRLRLSAPPAKRSYEPQFEVAPQPAPPARRNPVMARRDGYVPPSAARSQLPTSLTAECDRAKDQVRKIRQAQVDSKFADAAYTDEAERPRIDGYEALTSADALKKAGLTKDDLSIPGTTFRAVVYRNVKDGSYVVGFQGTNPKSLSDWKNNYNQGLNTAAAHAPNSYYVRAQEIAKDIAQKASRQNTTVKFVGHSLGGGLASAAARATGSDATTFNAAGLHEKTVSQVKSGGRVSAVYVKGEILTSAQKAFPIPEAANDDVMALDPPFSLARDLLPALGGMAGLLGPLAAAGGIAAGMAARSVLLHLMPSVVSSIERALTKAVKEEERACGGASV